jgi:hypothetical protein
VLSPASHSINGKPEAFGPLPDPIMGLREGKGARREGLKVSTKYNIKY